MYKKRCVFLCVSNLSRFCCHVTRQPTGVHLKDLDAGVTVFDKNRGCKGHQDFASNMMLKGGKLLSLGIQSYSQLMIGMSNHLLNMVFRFHDHSQKVIGSLGYLHTLLQANIVGWKKTRFRWL